MSRLNHGLSAFLRRPFSNSIAIFLLTGLAACSTATTPDSSSSENTDSASVEGSCPAVTVAESQGVDEGAYPQQFDLAEYESAAGCDMEFAANPDIESLNSQIAGNGDLPSLEERLPEEPLVVVPYAEVGQYGGTLAGLSKATESGTSDLLSIRHVNLFR
ncbi:MAG: hypothetical protein AAFQ57_16875, partial [Cyanobacteria bacterium J06626_14]